MPVINRRSMLAAGAAAAGVAPSAARAAGASKAWPFLWGTAGAAYQIEGGNVASDLWVMEHVKPTIFREPSGDALDTYNRVGEDIALAASLGFNTHRFSIEWSRIEPEPGQISLAAIAYYRGVLEKIRSHGMTPMATFSHFTFPRWFAAAGGFTTREGVAPFVRYCDLVARHLGDLMGLATTFNEPNLGALVSWLPLTTSLRPIIQASRLAAAQATGSPDWAPPLLGDFRVQQPIMIEAHNRAYEAIRKATGDRIPVGVSLALNDERPAAADNDGVEAKLAQALIPWLQASGDYVGLQNYSYALVGKDADLPPPAGLEMTQMNNPFAPEALEGAIRIVAARTSKPIYVTENGVATEDDTRRIAHIDGAVAGVGRCLADGIDVRGYVHWALLDNWEWFSGYGPKFGLVAVDRTTFARTPKPSARHLGAIASKGLPPAARKA